MLPDYIQKRARRRERSVRYKGYVITTYANGAKGNRDWFSYYYTKGGQFIDGGGPYIYDEITRVTGRDKAVIAAKGRIDRIIEKGYN